MKTIEHAQQPQVPSDLEGSRPLRPEAAETTVIPVMQEELDVRTRRVETDSGVRVSKTVDTHEEVIDELLTKEEVDVERIPVNRPVEGPVSVRYEGDTMIIPVLEEVLIVEKRLVLKEEIRVTRRRSEYRDPQRVVLRREIADVERIEDSAGRPDEGDRSGVERDTDSLLDRKRREEDELRRSVTPPPAHE